MNLSIYHNDKDYSLKMNDLTSKESVIALVDGEICIGYSKPIRNIYVEMIERKNEDDTQVEDEIDLTYFNGTEFVAPENINDFTFGLVQSGLITWECSDHKESELNGLSRFWFKLTTKNPAQISVNGINLVLSNDSDLLGFFPDLKSYLPSGKLSHIGFHQEARNKIVQFIRNSGKVIIDHKDLKTKQVDQFDLLQIEEFKQASKYLALKLIYSWLSRDDGDKWHDKSVEANADYIQSLNVRLMSIDENNNGKGEAGELNQIQTILIRNA